MPDCKYLQRIDVGDLWSNVFDHPTYKLYCCKDQKIKELLSTIPCKTCQFYEECPDIS